MSQWCSNSGADWCLEAHLGLSFLQFVLRRMLRLHLVCLPWSLSVDGALLDPDVAQSRAISPSLLYLSFYIHILRSRCSKWFHRCLGKRNSNFLGSALTLTCHRRCIHHLPTLFLQHLWKQLSWLVRTLQASFCFLRWLLGGAWSWSFYQSCQGR